MNSAVLKLKQLIETSDRILITSHISPDGDSVSSCLLLYQILKLNYPDKKIMVSMEEAPYDFDFLDAYEEIKFKLLPEILEQFKPDLLIILDSNALERVSRRVEELDFSRKNFKVAVIDHHVGNEIPIFDVYINDSSSAVTLDIYDIFIDQLKYQKPKNYAQTALTGIYTDTGGFVYSFANYNRVYEVVPKLLADGANLESIVANINKLTEADFFVLRDLIANTAYKADFTYSYLSDDITKPENHRSIVRATELFRVQYLRNIQNRPWGFIVYRDVAEDGSIYTVSFRAQTGKKDVSEFARKLGGGGHKPAAGAKFEAESVNDAVSKVLSVVGTD